MGTWLRRWRVFGALAAALAILPAARPAPVDAGVLVVVPTEVSFAAPEQSMWGADQAIFDTGTHFFGKSWGAFEVPSKPGPAKSLKASSDGNPSFDATVTGTTSGRIGVDVRAVLNTGSVRASYDSLANLTVAEQDATSPGVRRFLVATAEPEDPNVSFATTAPRVDVTSNLITILRASTAAEATLEFDGGKICLPLVGCKDLPDSTRTKSVGPVTLADFDETTQVLSVTNEDFQVFGNSITDRNELFREESGEDQLAITVDVGFDPLEVAAGTGLGLDVRVTDESNPKKPRKSKNLDPKDIVSLAFSMGDVTLYLPDLDTEADAFEVEEGERVLTTSGMTKLAKVDLDVDFLLSTGIASATGVAIPFGATFELGVGPVKISSEIDIVDADIGAVFFGAQEFSFTPRLDVTLDFSDDVAFRAAGAEEWSFGRTATGRVGQEFEIEYAGGGDLAITPTYSFGNDFTNTTDILLGGQFALKILGFDLRAPFGIPIIGPVTVFQDVFETASQVKLGTAFNETFSLASADVEAQSVTLGGVVGEADGEFAAELISGSPTSLTQSVDTPADPFSVVFDYLFETLTGELSVMLDGVLLGSLVASDTLQNGFLGASFQVAKDSPLIGRADVPLTFVLDGAEGSSILLDNIAFLVGGTLVGIRNGGFESGNFARWVGLSEGEGGLNVVRIADDSPRLPEPRVPWAVAAAFVLLASLRRLRSART